jgi:hypothetical protein
LARRNFSNNTPMTEQLELFNKRKRDKQQADADLQAFMRFLGTQCEPVTAKTLKHILGHDDRYIRHLAEISDGRILGTDLGYELAEKAPESRFEQWAARYRSQIEKMQQRLRRTAMRRATA